MKPFSNGTKQESRALQLVATLVQLSIWTYLGVITRIFLDKFFQLGCDGGWGPCVQGGVYFSALPSNVLGSFIMGLLATSSQLGLAAGRPVAILPASHPWQRNSELQIGLRTGYCGSLTTFGGWVSEAMTGAIRHNAWANGLGALFVGATCSVSAFVMGTHVVLAVDRAVLREDVLRDSLEFRSARISEASDPNAAVPDVVGDGQREAMDAAGDIPRAAVASEQKGQKAGTAPAHIGTVPRTDLVVALCLAGATAALASGAALETRHLWLRAAWFACLLAPLGSILRWQLAVRANYSPVLGRGAWFPWGTLAANLLGTALTAGMAALELRGGLGHWGTVMTRATSDGFCGALTTVSTLVAEFVKLAELFPVELHVYTYSLASMLGGIATVFAAYAWAPWS